MNLGNLNKMVIIVALLLREKKTRNKILIIQIPLFQELKGGKKISHIPCYFPILAKVTFVAKEPLYSTTFVFCLIFISNL